MQMNNNVRIISSAIDKLEKEYNMMFSKCYTVSNQLLGYLQAGETAVFSSLAEIGTHTQILLAIKHVFSVGAYLYVIDNSDISTAEIIKPKDDECYQIVGSEELLKQKKPIVDVIIKHIDDEFTTFDLPADFSLFYWQYELGKTKVSYVCAALNVSKPYFYRLCDTYEKTIDYQREQFNKSTDLILAPKKRECDYKKIINLLLPYQNIGLNNEAIVLLEKELDASSYDIWRILLAMKKSRYYFYYLKNNPDKKKCLLMQDIDYLLKYIKDNTSNFLEQNSTTFLKYDDPNLRLADLL